MSDKVVNIVIQKTVNQIAITTDQIPKCINIAISRTFKQVEISAYRMSRLVNIVAYRPVHQINIDVNRALTPGQNFDFTNFITEQLLGAVDGENRIFTTSVKFITTSLSVFINGLKQYDFLILSDSQIMVDVPPKNTGFTDIIEATYIKK